MTSTLNQLMYGQDCVLGFFDFLGCNAGLIEPTGLAFLVGLLAGLARGLGR